MLRGLPCLSLQRHVQYLDASSQPVLKPLYKQRVINLYHCYSLHKSEQICVSVQIVVMS